MDREREDRSDVLDSVKCVVNTCQYHTKGDHCSAKSILVEPKNASTSDDTDCSTFRPTMS